METLLDYAPDASVSLDHQAEEVLLSRLEMIADHEEARQTPPRDGEVPYRPLPSARLYLDRDDWDLMLAMGPSMIFSPYGKPDGAEGVDAGGRPGTVFTKAGAGVGENVFQQLKAQASVAAAQNRRTVVAAWTRGSRERISHLLRENGIAVEQADTWPEVRGLPVKTPAVVTLGLERGFIAGDLSPSFAIIGEQDLLGERISRPPRRRKRADQFIAEATEIAEGDPGGAPGIRHRPL